MWKGILGTFHAQFYYFAKLDTLLAGIELGIERDVGFGLACVGAGRFKKIPSTYATEKFKPKALCPSIRLVAQALTYYCVAT